MVSRSGVFNGTYHQFLLIGLYGLVIHHTIVTILKLCV